MGGVVWFDNEPSLLYRQHSANVIGSNEGLRAQINRMEPLFKGRFKQWTDANVAAALDLGTLVAEPQSQIFTQFKAVRAQPMALLRILAWLKTKVRRQTLRSNLTLVLALLIQRI